MPGWPTQASISTSEEPCSASARLDRGADSACRAGDDGEAGVVRHAPAPRRAARRAWPRSRRRAPPSSRSPSSAVAPAGSPSTPFGLTEPHAVAAQSIDQLGHRRELARLRRVQPHRIRVEVRGAARSRCARRGRRRRATLAWNAIAPPTLAAQPGDRGGDRVQVAAVAVDEQQRVPIARGVAAQLDEQLGQRGACRSTACRGTRRARRSLRRRPAAPPPTPSRPPAAPRATATRDPGVGVERQVRAVLLERPERHEQSPPRSAVNLSPIQVSEICHRVLNYRAPDRREERRTR